jgi:hypothetical protein
MASLALRGVIFVGDQDLLSGKNLRIGRTSMLHIRRRRIRSWGGNNFRHGIWSGGLGTLSELEQAKHRNERNECYKSQFGRTRSPQIPEFTRSPHDSHRIAHERMLATFFVDN